MKEGMREGRKEGRKEGMNGRKEGKNEGMKEDMKGVVCRFFKRHDSGHSALVTVYQTQVKVKGKTTTTKTKTETRTEKKVIGSPRPWDVEKKEVLGVTKTQSVEVAEDTIVAYQIVAENARKRSEQ